MTLRTLELDSDVYVTVPRGGSMQVLANDGYERMQLIDCVELSVVGQIPFPDDATPYPIHRWWISPNGAWVLLYSHEQDFALQLDLDSGQASRVAVPMSMGTPSPTCWFEPRFQLMTDDGLMWGIDNGTFVLQAPSESFTRWTQRAMAASRPFRSCAHFKADPGAGILYLLAKDPDRIGWIGTSDPEVTLGPPADGVVDFAWRAGRWFVGYHDRIEVIDPKGKRRALLELATNERLGRLNVVAHRGSERLVALTSLASNDRDRLHVLSALPSM
jgi:hypothetical protein